MKKALFLAGLFFITQCTAQKNTNNMMKDILAPYPFTTKYIKSNKGELAYVEAGKGDKTLIFIHGLSSNADAWSKNIEVLQKKYRCIAIDLPGYGRSYKVGEAFTPTIFADAVKQLMTQLKINKAVVVGHSMGGQTAIKFAANNPELVSSLVLVAPAGIEEFTALEGNMMTAIMTQQTVESTTDEQIRKNYETNFNQMPKEVEQMIKDRINIKHAADFGDHAMAIQKSVKGMLDDKVIDDLSKIKVPTLVMYGDKDMLIPNRYFHANMTVNDVANKAKDLIRNSEVKIISDGGHFLQYEKAKEVNDEILNFLK